MSNLQTVSFDPIRTVAFGGISGSFAPIGTPFTNPVRLVCITNNTNGDLFFSDDGVTTHLFIPAGGFKLFDLNTNRTNQGQWWILPANTQFYVKQSTAPTSGAVYLECLWGQ